MEEAVVESFTESYGRDGYIVDQSHFTSAVLCSHNAEFTVMLFSKDLEIRGLHELRIIYFRQKPSYQHSVVDNTSSSNDILSCAILTEEENHIGSSKEGLVDKNQIVI